MGAAKTLCTPFDQPELPEGSLLPFILANYEFVHHFSRFLILPLPLTSLQEPFVLLQESLQRNGLTGVGATD